MIKINIMQILIFIFMSGTCRNFIISCSLPTCFISAKDIYSPSYAFYCLLVESICRDRDSAHIAPAPVIHMPTHAALKRPRSRSNSRGGSEHTRDDFFITAEFPFRFGMTTIEGEFIQSLSMKAFIRPEIVICRGFSGTTQKESLKT